MSRRVLLLLVAVSGALAAAVIVRFPKSPSPSPEEASPPEPRAAVPSARVTISDDGALLFSEPGAPDRSIGTLESANPEVQRATLDRLRDRLRLVTAGTEDANAWSTPTVAVAVAPATPWSRVLWILEVASSSARVRRVRFELPGAPADFVTHDLTYDWEQTEAGRWGGSDLVLWVRLAKQDGGVETATPPHPTMRVSIAVVRAEEWRGFPLYGNGLDWKTSWATTDGVRRATVEAGGSSLGVTGCVVDVSRPERPILPYGPIFTVLRALRDEGVTRVQLLHRSTDLPGAR